MADTTRRASEAAERRRLGIPDTRPRPVGQSFWLLASVAIGGLAVFAASEGYGDLGERAAAGIEAADLIELADRQRPELDAGQDSALDSGLDGTEPGSAPSSPTTMVAPGTGGRADGSVGDLPAYELVGREALAQISYPWAELLPEWTIMFEPSTEGLFGLTMVPERRIEIYVRPDQSPSMLSHVIAHELGHAIDVTLNTGPDRRRWSELRGIGSAPWWPESGANDFATGAGDFAESFAAWQVGPSGFRSTLATPPDAAAIELLAELSAG